jgi:hypothetical protein
VLDIFSISVVLIRTVALLIIAGALSAIPAVWVALKYATFPAEGYDKFNTSIIIGAVSHLLLALLLLIFAKQFARFLTRGLENANVQLKEPRYDVLQAVAFSILGMYILLYTIPALMRLIVIEYLPSNSNPTEGAYPTAERRSVPVEVLVEYLAQAALAIWLVLGSRGIATWLRGFWTKNISAECTEDAV